MENTTTPAATPNHKIGDIANGHVLTEQGWLPLGTPAPAPKRKKGRKVLAVSGALMLSLVACTAMISGTDAGTAAEPTATPSASATATPTPEEPATPSETELTPEAEATPEQTVTKAQENALRAAESYLDTMAFSKAGLIDQLSSEYGSGFDKADAKWAVAQLDVDWNEQAVRAGESYLDTMPFSRQGLIDQLSSEYGSQFTKAQATYAVDQMGL